MSNKWKIKCEWEDQGWGGWGVLTGPDVGAGAVTQAVAVTLPAASRLQRENICPRTARSSQRRRCSKFDFAHRKEGRARAAREHRRSNAAPFGSHAPLCCLGMFRWSFCLLKVSLLMNITDIRGKKICLCGPGTALVLFMIAVRHENLKIKNFAKLYKLIFFL